MELFEEKSFKERFLDNLNKIKTFFETVKDLEKISKFDHSTSCLIGDESKLNDELPMINDELTIEKDLEMFENLYYKDKMTLLLKKKKEDFLKKYDGRIEFYLLSGKEKLSDLEKILKEKNKDYFDELERNTPEEANKSVRTTITSNDNKIYEKELENYFKIIDEQDDSEEIKMEYEKLMIEKPKKIQFLMVGEKRTNVSIKINRRSNNIYHKRLFIWNEKNCGVLAQILKRRGLIPDGRERKKRKKN